uniref:Uncharacterized protein n=1 Tax=Macrostomum lignano TaxID=282301 RepID=A0A1I8JLV3_9PLAT
MANSELFRQMVFLPRRKNLEAVFTLWTLPHTKACPGSAQEAGRSKLNVSVSIEDASSGGSEEVQLSVKSLVINTRDEGCQSIASPGGTWNIDRVESKQAIIAARVQCLACWGGRQAGIQHWAKRLSAEELKRSGRSRSEELLDNGELLLCAQSVDFTVVSTPSPISQRKSGSSRSGRAAISPRFT